MAKSRTLTAALAALAACAPFAAARAQGPIETYNARLSAQDHYNSSGQRLTSVAAIIRQDRAYFHRFGRGDPDDQGDRFFASANNRARLEAMIARGRIGRGAATAIVDGTPRVHVEIYPDFVNVTVY